MSLWHYLRRRWPAFLLSIILAAGQAVVMNILHWQPIWLLPLLYVLFLMLSIGFYDPELKRARRLDRWFAQLFIFLMVLANLISLGLLLWGSFGPTATIPALDLLIAGAALWLVNMLTFGLVFWEIDGGGPERRQSSQTNYPDLLFPQQTLDVQLQLAPADWRPQLLDYLYTSLTAAIAFSPTDTMPLTRRLKVLMGAENLISFVVFALLIARAVNLISS